MFVKPEKRAEARHLRADGGLAIGEIAKRLGVAKSSVSLWVRDIELTPEQEAALVAADPVRNGRLTGMRASRERCRSRRAEAQEHGRALARLCDPVHRGGCMLYWGEGSKSRNCAQVANADKDLLRTFVDFLRASYGVPAERFRFSVNCFLGNGLELDDIERSWLAALDLPPTCLRTAVVNRASAASKRRRYNMLLYGTGRVSVHSTFIVQSIYGAIQEYAGIDRPEWLDR